jgi:hypothetical protein
VLGAVEHSAILKRKMLKLMHPSGEECSCLGGKQMVS